MSVMLIGLVIFAGVSFFQFVAPIALSAFVGVKVAFLALANLVIEEDWLRQFTWQQTAKHIAFGFGVGLLIGFIRLKFGRRYGQARLVECFVNSFGDPIAVQAAGVSNACLALHVIVSVAISLGLEALGVTFSYGLTGGVGAASPLADAFISIAGGSGPPGGGPGSYGALSGIMVLLFAIILLIFIVSFLAGVISHLAIALASGKVVSMSAVAAGAIQGAQASVGRTIGIAFVMALTRQSMPEVARHLPEVRTKPDFERELREFRFRGNVTSAESQPLYKALDAFKSWRQTYHPNLTIEGYDACVKEYAMRPHGMDAAAVVGLERKLLAFSRRFREWERAYNSPPKQPIPEKLPPLIGGAGSLLYDGWLRTALNSGIRTGLITGSAYVVVVSLIAAMLEGASFSVSVTLV